MTEKNDFCFLIFELYYVKIYIDNNYIHLIFIFVNIINKFVHICGKDYTKTTDRVIKCYTNDANNGKLSLYVNGTFVEEANATDNIVLFTAYNFSSGDVVRVDGAESSDTFTF